MLFLLHKGNHSDLSYTQGQRPIVHLRADLRRVVEWANSEHRKWASSNGNAGTRYTRFFDNLEELEKLDWNAIEATNWKDLMIRERKQAEFLVYGCFPWELVERIGVADNRIATTVQTILSEAVDKPEVVVTPNWYY